LGGWKGYSKKVSIPRSEFWSFGPENLFHQIEVNAVSIPRSEFWSFGQSQDAARKLIEEVSIPRSEFWSFGREFYLHSLPIKCVSIPRSEFWSFGLGFESRQGYLLVFGFNSSVGILVVRTLGISHRHGSLGEFQFLGRNSGRSD